MKKIDSFFIFLATYFGIGRLPKAPGTWATIATIPLFLVMAKLSPVTYMMVVFCICLVGIYASQVYEKYSNKHDSQEIVIDEVAGFLITMTLVPVNSLNIAIGFVLFRLLDIFKPGPIGYLDRKVQGGMGVMVDDIAAGLLASIIMQIYLNYF